ncbi:MAG TPA: YiiG family protein [Xanthomonadaceae bacterium]|nr:YiiG family protein [Xanthomonadaceae bacterium]
MRIDRLLAVSLLLGMMSSAVASAQDIEQDVELAKKLDTYIRCANYHSERIFDSRNRYHSWVGKRGPTGRERIVYGLYEVHSPGNCPRNIAAAAERPPHLDDLHEAGAAWAEALRTVHGLVVEAYRYYDMENYKDDRMKRGKEMHQPLVDAFDRFAAADKALSEQIRLHTEGLQTRRLERLAADPERRVDYLLLASMRHARAALSLAKPSGDRSFQRDAFDAEVAQFETLLAELEQTQRRVSKSAGMSGYLSNGNTFLRTAKTLSRMHRDRKRHDTFFLPESPELVEGHPGKMLYEFNRMVSDFNRI